MSKKTTEYYASRAAAIIAAVIFFQTLYFKFSASPESVYIFSQLGAEPWGRLIAGVAELVAGILLLFRRTSIWGALLGLGIIGGAILSHLFVLGIEIQGDGGLLFFLALAVLVMCILILVLRRAEVKALIPFK